MSKVKIGIVGCSGFGLKQHYGSLKGFDDVELVAICEPITEKREQYAREFEIPRQYENHTEMLEKVEMDAVYAVMAPHRSYDVAFHFVREGIPIFLEKPGVVNSYQAENLADVAAKSGALTMVGFNRRFMPIMCEAKRRVEAGGPLVHCVSTFYKHAPKAEYYDGAISYLMCDAIHAVDALRWMGGDVAKVRSVTGVFDTLHYNAAIASVRFEGGAVGALLTHWSVAARFHTFEMHSLNCSAYVNPDGKTRILTVSPEGGDEPSEEMLDAAEVAGGAERVVSQGFRAEDRHFVDCVKAKRQPQTHIADVAKSLRLAETIICSGAE